MFVHVATAGDVVDYGRDVEPAEAALVFGTLVEEDGTLSQKLAERVEVAAALYRDGVVPRLIMSGTDASDTGQDETARMRDYAIALGVPSEAITLDPLGLDTFASCNRAAIGVRPPQCRGGDERLPRRASDLAMPARGPSHPRRLSAANRRLVDGGRECPRTRRSVEGRFRRLLAGLTALKIHARCGKRKPFPVQRADSHDPCQNGVMGRFTRGARKSDADFTFLTADEGSVLRALVVEAFARKGLAVTKNGDHVVGPNGQLFGLQTLAVQCHGFTDGLHDWIPAVEAHVASMIAASEVQARSA